MDRHPDDRIGQPAYRLGQAPCLVAEQPGRRRGEAARVCEVVQVTITRAVRGEDLQARGAQLLDRLLDRDARHHRQVEQAAGRGPNALAVVRVDTLVSQHHRARASGVGGPQDRTGVAGVADVHQHGDQPGPLLQRRRERHVEERADGHDALRSHRAGQPGQDLGRKHVHGDSGALGALDQVEVLGPGLRRNEHLTHSGRVAVQRRQGLAHGLRTLGQEGSIAVAEPTFDKPTGRRHPPVVRGQRPGGLSHDVRRRSDVRRPAR